MSACVYQAGKIDGECKSYDENGRLSQEEMYKNGIPFGANILTMGH